MTKMIPELFAMLKPAKVEIKKEHQVLMVNKTTSFKKRGKGKRKGTSRKNGKQVATPMMKPNARPKPETECFYCKGNVHSKRNCPKYLADKKDGKVKGIFDIHVIDVYFTSVYSNPSVFDTSSVAKISNLNRELQNEQRLVKGEVTMRVGSGSKIDMIIIAHSLYFPD